MNMKSPVQLREKKPRLGTWLSIGSPVIAELAAESGFDWLLFDLEHGCGFEAALLPQLQAIRSSGAAAIVRVGAPHPDLIARVLDWGADGVMIPHVSTVAEAEACVQAAHYPPRGRRGFSRTVRAYGYGLRPPAESKLPEPIIIAQIETIEAVENAGKIACVDGVDVLFVGPSDLNFDLKARPKLAKRDYAVCLDHVITAAAEAGKSCGILTRDAAELPALRKQGFDWLAMDSDLAILRNGYRKLVEGFGV
ncbi:MAG: 2-dehydro-3-deoxyglucarate aldolase [Verrucomicrobia bacterium]|nr:2-dehydro-3-deoxyglucarate aldolase [Verrucomicrobiota bacterium]